MWHLAWWRQFGGDAVVGSLLVGAVLAVAFAVPTYRIALRRSRQPEISALIEETSLRYLETGLFNCEFVRGKLRHDPVYFHLLRQGALPTESRLLDLGCGRGILFSLLLTARAQAERGIYPADWAPPPHLTFFGIEGREEAAEVARQALGAQAHIETADLTEGITTALPAADVVLLLDVLHYLPPTAQEDLLARIAAALSPGGLLLIRDADADAGWRFTATRIQERLSSLARRRWRQRFYYRGRREWSEILEKLGFEVIDQPMGEGTPYANVLITARRQA
jgi:SAM-dependent methyltransferase